MVLKKPMLTANEISSIIKLCAKAKVTSFHFGDLRISFETSKPEKLIDTNYSSEPVRDSDPIPSEKHDIQTNEALEIEELKLKQARLDLMFIENPLEAEQLITSGALDGTEDDGDET